MVIITAYREELREGRDGEFLIYIISEEESICPICGSKLYVIGIRRRKTTERSGEEETLVIRRLRCKICRKIHHELPEKVMPYKRHCAETIENIVAGEAEDVCCDFLTERRIRIWWSAFLLYFESIKESLRMKYGAVFSQGATPREIVRAVANANLWAHTRTAKTPA